MQIKWLEMNLIIKTIMQTSSVFEYLFHHP